MTKKFAEHSGLDLTKVNNEILEMWNKNDIFHKSIDEREGVHSLCSSKVLLRQMVIQAFIMCSPVQSRIPSTAIRR